MTATAVATACEGDKRNSTYASIAATTTITAPDAGVEETAATTTQMQTRKINRFSNSDTQNCI